MQLELGASQGYESAISAPVVSSENAVLTARRALTIAYTPMHGVGGDTLESYRTGDDGYLLDCDARKSTIRIYGDGDNDTISGSRGKDLLVGGKGRDMIDGNANRDTCSGEKLRSCEIKRR